MLKECEKLVEYVLANCELKIGSKNNLYSFDLIKNEKFPRLRGIDI